MNGSRSNTPTNGGRASLDQLNRTIEGLEARIQGLMGEKKTAAAQIRTPGADPMTEIVERQKALGSARERVSAMLEQRNSRSHEQPPREWREPVRPQSPAAAPSLQDETLREISATLSALRSELKHDLSDGLSRDLGILHSEMQGLKSLAANSSGTDGLRQDLARLAQSIGRLEQDSPALVHDLRADLDDLRGLVAGAAREDSLRHLEQRWDRAESHIAQIDTDSLKEELVQLAWRIDSLKSGLGELSAAPAVRALEDKLIAIANTIETIGHNVQSQHGSAEQFAGLDRRLDEISRAIAVSARQAGATDNAALQRLESRINDLVAHVETLSDVQSEPENAMADRIEALTARIDEIANEEAARRLEDRIGQLTSLIERNVHDFGEPQLTGHLADISRKIDGLGTGQGDALLERLEALSRKMDELDMPAPAQAVSALDRDAVARLEGRLADIAIRLDESVAAPISDNGALKNLERQIANLSALMERPNAASSQVGLPDGFGDRMAALEDYIASSDEFIVEAARQAAEAVVEAYSRGGMPGAANASDLSALNGLAEDLRALEQHTRVNEERTHDTFAALHETLVQIAGRLDDLGRVETVSPAPRAAETVPVAKPEPQPEPVRAAAAAPVMPKAAQPDFLAEITEPPARRAPTNPKVDIFDESELALDTVTATAVEDLRQEPAAKDGAKKAPASKSLIAGLAAKLKPGKKPAAAETARVAVDPAPALDASDVFAPQDNSILLEPGSGVPDVKKILEKVRAGQQAGNGNNLTGAAGSQPDVIAAARRAAQAAVAEAGAQKAAMPLSGKTKMIKDKVAKPATAGGDSKRPILLAAAAVLLVVMSYPLVSNLINGNSDPAAADIQAQQPAQVIQPAEAVPADTSSALTPDSQPLAAENKPAETATADPSLELPAMEQKSNMLAPAEVPDAAATPVDPAVQGELQIKDAPDMAPATNTVAEAKPATPGIELPADLKPASLVEAAKRGEPLALFEIGARFTDGRGTKVDLAKAATWYQQAADKGFAPAQYRLASFYEKGTGVTRDVEKARALYQAAAEKGNASAMHNLAVLYATGAAGTPDFNQAAKWFQAAADLNVRDSQFNLAILFARGNGVPQDLQESYKWFAIAAAEGDQDAAQKRDEVANALNPEQLAAAKAKLSLWKAKPLNDDANSAVVPDEWVAKANTTATIDMKRAIRNIQAILNNNGFDAGKPDGEMGAKTIAAIKAFQKSVGQTPSGKIDDALVKELLNRNKKS